jgi:hypothetical protein
VAAVPWCRTLRLKATKPRVLHRSAIDQFCHFHPMFSGPKLLSDNQKAGPRRLLLRSTPPAGVPHDLTPLHRLAKAQRVRSHADQGRSGSDRKRVPHTAGGKSADNKKFITEVRVSSNRDA